MNETPEFVTVNTTVESEADAARLAGLIVESRLAACAQYFPIRSVYRWKGRVESSSEFLVLAKTRNVLADRLCAFIKDNHGYEVPEILVTPVIGGSGPYLDWIRTETSAS